MLSLGKYLGTSNIVRSNLHNKSIYYLPMEESSKNCKPAVGVQSYSFQSKKVEWQLTPAKHEH